MKIERTEIERLLALAEQRPQESYAVHGLEVVAICRAWLALDAAPVVRIGNSDAFSCFLEKPQGSEAGPVHAMLGQRVRLVPTHSAGGE